MKTKTMKLINILTMILLTYIAYGQSLFNRTYSKPSFDYSDAVIERQDGKYLIAGSSQSQASTDYDVNILLVDSIGNLIWDKFLGQNIKMEFGYSLIETKDNNYLICGSINSRPYLTKFNSSGNMIWEKEYSTNLWAEGFSVGETIDSNYFFVSPDTSTILFKTNSQGDSLWTKRYNFAICRSVQQTSDSGFVLIGNTTTTTTNQDIVIIKTNSNGDTLWTKIFGENGQDDATSIQQLSDKGYIIAGSFDPQIIDGENETYIIRINSIGDTVWTQKYYLGVPQYIKECSNNNGYILSSTRSIDNWFPPFSEHYLIITRLDTNGNIQWSRQFYGNSYSLGNNVTQTSDGYFLLTGYTDNNSSSADIVLIKLDSIGNFVLSVNEILTESNPIVSVFPNPTNDELNFILNFNEKIKQVKIFNTLGQEFEYINYLNELQFKTNVKEYTTGLYFYKITTRDNQKIMGKFIVKE